MEEIKALGGEAVANYDSVEDGDRIYAREGFDDIADMMVRPNLTPNFSPHAYRVKTARWALLWPELTVLPPAGIETVK